MFTRSNGSGIASNPKVREAAFQDAIIKENLNSDAVEVSNTHVVVLRVNKHQSATPKMFDEVKASIVTELKTAKAGQMAADEASSIFANIQKQVDGWKQAAAANKKDVTSLNLVKRDSDKADRIIIQTAFTLAKPAANGVSVKQVKLTNGNSTIVAVHSVVDAEISKDKASAVAERKQFNDNIANQEFAAVVAAIKSQFEIYIPERSEEN